MTPNKLWTVRAGRGAALIDDFITKSAIAVGFDYAEPVNATTAKDDVIAAMRTTAPEKKLGDQGRGEPTGALLPRGERR